MPEAYCKTFTGTVSLAVSCTQLVLLNLRLKYLFYWSQLNEFTSLKTLFFFSLKEHRVIDLRSSTSKWENRWQQSLNKPLEVAVYFTVLEKGCFYLSIIISFHVFEGRIQFLIQKIFKWCDKSITVLEWKPLDRWKSVFSIDNLLRLIRYSNSI